MGAPPAHAVSQHLHLHPMDDRPAWPEEGNGALRFVPLKEPPVLARRCDGASATTAGSFPLGGRCARTGQDGRGEGDGGGGSGSADADVSAIAGSPANAGIQPVHSAQLMQLAQLLQVAQLVKVNQLVQAAHSGRP